MNASRRIVLAGSLLILAGTALLAQEAEPAKAPRDGALAKEDRYLLHLSTDRPSYRPGETVHARGLLLHALTRAPHAQRIAVGLDIESPRGDSVAKGHAVSDAGAGMGFRWTVPEDAAGGFYTLKAKPEPGYAPAELGFEVRAYRQPRLNTDLQFVRKAYGPGDRVEATLEVTRAEGGVPAGATAIATARVDGRAVSRQTLKLDGAGKLLVRFQLPAKVETPDATLAIVVQDGGVQETAAKSIPVVLSRLDIAVFPEGGDLVAGLPGRVYVEARNLSGDPADVRGRVLDTKGRVVAKLATEHEGRGRFTFTPVAGQRYRIAIDEPAGITAETALPEVKTNGLSLQTRDELLAAGAPLVVTVAGNLPNAQKGKLTVSIRDRVIASGTVPLGSAPNPVTLHLPEWAGGVLRVTLHDAAGLPRAERLVYRAPRAGVQVKLTADPARSTPRGKVTLKVETTQDGEPIDALIALRVVDDSTLERVDVRDRAPRLKTQVLLGSEVKELKDANVYLNDPEQGARATDLLLGTQGWRRFAFVNVAEFERAHGDLAKRIVARRGNRIQVWQPAAPGFGGAMPADEPMEDGGVAEGAMPDVEAPDEKGAADPQPEAAPEPERLDENAEKPRAEPMRQQAKKEQARVEADMDDVMAGEEMELEEEPMARGRVAGKRLARLRDRRAPAAPPWMPAASGPFAVVREFAFRAKAGGNVRTQFAETLYWSAGVRTGADGVHEVSFDLNDSITTFRAQVDAVGPDGSLAWAEATVESRRPFYMEPKLPLEITGGDLVEIPVAVVNGTDGQAEVKMTFGAGPGLKQLGGPLAPVALGPDGRGRVLIRFEAEDTRGQVAVRLRGSARGAAGRHEDDVARTITVVPRGFPIELAWGGQLSAETPIRNTIAIPASVTPGSIVAEAAVHPTPLASLAEALAALLREPGGCFEQTSSNNYPNVMAMQYMDSHEGVDPELKKRAAGMLDRGYDRLVSFECKEKGYEWFGGDPGHEALTAYGLLEFTDMAQVMPVDDGMVQRTRAWLLSRRDGKGGFQRNSRALDSFGRAPEETTNAYVTWALVEAGETEVTREAEAVLAGALASEDSYVIALAANVALRRGDAQKARGLMQKLAKAISKEGFVDGAVTSVTCSGGRALRVETTSLAILAWLQDSDFTEATERSMRWLLAQCQGGRFGSTQATILALRAIVTYDKARARPKADGTVLIVVDGEVIDEAPFQADASGAIKLPKFADALGPGEHTVELKMVRGSSMPASLIVRYRAETPATSPATKVTLATSLVDATVKEGEATEVEVKVENTTRDGLPMTVAVVGIPGGLEVRTDRLEELKRAGAFDFVETRGRDVVLYWRDMRPREVKEVTLSVVAQVPGRYTGAPSRAYLYYTDEDKVWTPGLGVTIPPGLHANQAR